MPSQCRLVPIVLACTLVAGGVSLAAAAPTVQPEAQPRPEMRRVLEAVTHLLPLAMNEEAWSDPGRREEVERWLSALAERTQEVESHAGGRDVGFRNLSRSLSANVDEIRVRYELGRHEEARFFVIETTGSCVACHSRLPSDREVPLAGHLLEKIDFDQLEPQEKTHLLIATRQFDKALSVWEETFASTSPTPSYLDAGGFFIDYLVIALRVELAPERARKTLERVLRRDDIPHYLRRDLISWIRAIDASKPALQAEPTLERARAFVFGEVGPSPGPLEKDQLVYDLVASSVLLRLIDASPQTRALMTPQETAKLAEAFYLLGLVEARSIDSFWVPQAEFHFETAIRLLPGAAWVEDAYAAFEELLITGYGGAQGDPLPADVLLRLKDLRALIDDQAPARKTSDR